MPRTPDQRRAARETVRSSRNTIIQRYRNFESMNKLASEFGVSPKWLADRFDEWGEPRRGRAAAYAVLGARVTPPATGSG